MSKRISAHETVYEQKKDEDFTKKAKSRVVKVSVWIYLIIIIEIMVIF